MLINDRNLSIRPVRRGAVTRREWKGDVTKGEVPFVDLAEDLRFRLRGFEVLNI